MRLAPVFLASVALLLSVPALALDCVQAVTTPDINACAAADQKKVEAELNVVYTRVLQNLQPANTETENDSKLKAALIDAQRAWVKFREADCKALFARYEGGTIRTVMYLGCMQQHAEQRVKDLEEYEK
jgi:uncharacterized protein YecT (DUF1311 family)